MKTALCLGVAAWLVALAMTTFDGWVYGVTRLVVPAAGIYFWFSYEETRPKMAYALGILALIFNPFIPVRMGREAWQWVDAIAAALFLAAAPAVAALPARLWNQRSEILRLAVISLMIGGPIATVFLIAAHRATERKQLTLAKAAQAEATKTVAKKRTEKEATERQARHEAWETNRHRFEARRD